MLDKLKKLLFFFRDAYPYYKKFNKLILLNFIVLFISAFFEGVGFSLLIPVFQSIGGEVPSSGFSKYIYDIFVEFGFEYTFTTLMLMFAFAMLAKYFFITLQQYLSRVLSSNFTMHLRNQIVDNLTSVSLFYFGKKKTGDIVSIVFNATNSTGSILEYVSILVKGIIFGLTYMVVGSIISPTLVLLLTITILVVYFFIFPIFVRSKVHGELEKDITNDTISYLSDVFSGIKVVKSYALESRIISKTSKLFKDFQSVAVKIVKNKIQAFILFEPVLMLVLVGVTIYAVEVTELSLEELVVSLAIFSQIIPHFKAINANLIQIAVLVPYYNVIDSMISKKGKSYLVEGTKEISKINSEVVFDKVFFSYPGVEATTLNSVSFSIPLNKTIAIVGGSGGGKTTLLNLLLRNYLPNEGHIYVDGIDFQGIKESSWKPLVAVVDQESYLFHDTIYNNIVISNPHATKQDVDDAIEDSFLDDFVNSLSDGLQTIVGDRGFALSGGQRQRIALARALIKKPQLLLLDEATSALDTESEAFILDVIKKLQNKITIIIIAHRFSTIRNANNILLIEKGKILENGSHEELMQQKGKYYSYYSQQQLP